jgi:hypothetical protein
MRIVVKNDGKVIEAGVESASYYEQKDPQVALQSLRMWEDRYRTFIRVGKELIAKLRQNPDDLQLRWDIGDLIQSFLSDNAGFEIVDCERSIARDLELPPTEKRSDISAADVKALLKFRQFYPDKKLISPHISWNLFYFANDILTATRVSKIITGMEALTNDLLDIANYQAKLGTKGNGAAIKLSKRLIQTLLKHNLL